MPMHCVHGQAPWPVSLGPLRPGRRALSKLCPPSRGTDPSAPAGRPDKAEDPDALQSLADLETTAGRIWNLTMDVAAAATAGDESSEKGQREGDDDASFALQQRLEDLSMLQTSQMQQLMVETKQTKQDAVAAVLGRVSSGTIDDQRNFSTQWLQREQRVLDALISIVEESDVTDEELRGLVNDACTPPEESKPDQDAHSGGDDDDDDDNTEQMWTTPMALATAIDRAISYQTQDAVPSEHSSNTIQTMAQLTRIRDCLLDIVDPDTRAWLADR